MKKTTFPDLTIPILLLIDGSICTLTAIFAHAVGLDPNKSWGSSRFTFFFIGTMLILLSLFIIFLKKKSPFESIIKSKTAKTIFLLPHLWVFIFAIYIWFITYGTFKKWDITSNYYAQLADAFNQGQLYLELKPSEAITTTPDPYNPIHRPYQDGIWDMSLYERKLYLYWGPIPALLIAPIQQFLSIKVMDIFINLFFYAGLLIFNSLIILHLWKNFFPKIPAENVYICIPLIGLLAPILWALTPSTIYGAAIGSGQFFLMGGIFLLLPIFKQIPSYNKSRLFLTGLFWACSVGSRAMNAFLVIFMTILIIIWVAVNSPKPFNWKQYTQIATSLFTPLIVGAIIIGWYNWARFDSPLEFGMRYQITFFNLDKQNNLVFQPDYFPLNLYVYILQPFRFGPGFPFIFPQYTPDILDQFNITPPKMFFAGRMTGFLFSAPFLSLSLIPLFSKNKVVQENNLSEDNRSLVFIIYTLAGSSLVGLLSLIFFFFGQMRYLVDIISQITLLAIIGYWIIISLKLGTNSTKRKILVYLANSLIVLTICIGLLLGVTGESSRLQKSNPLVLEKINNFLMFQR